jgi:hypothetical protein
MSRISARNKAFAVTAFGPALALSLVACGGGSSGSTTAASTSTPNASATGAPGTAGAGRAGVAGADFTKIQACLSAAGISLPTRSGAPRASGAAGGTPPSGAVRPTGGTGGGNGAGAGGGLFASAQVQAALKACGITVPTGGGRPTVTPTS